MKKIIVLGLLFCGVFGTVAPTEAFRPFSFAVIADPHLSVATPDSPPNGVKMFKASEELLQVTIEQINQTDRVDFVVILGDLTKDAQPWNVDRCKEVLDELRRPWYVVLGNHDISPVDTGVRGLNPGVTRSTMIWTFQGHGFDGPAAHWSLDPAAGVHLIGLDSNITGDWGGRVTAAGLRFLERDLAANTDKLTIVLLHHQLQAYTPAEAAGEPGFARFVLYNADTVKTILQAHPQVALALSGHRHLSTRYIQEAQIGYFILPSTVTWPMRYAIFDVEPNRIAYHTYDVPCRPELWDEARAQARAADWPYIAGTPQTPDEHARFADLMCSNQSRNGVICLHPATLRAVTE